jgi:hypothetical protein
MYLMLMWNLSPIIALIIYHNHNEEISKFIYIGHVIHISIHSYFYFAVDLSKFENFPAWPFIATPITSWLLLILIHLVAKNIPKIKKQKA